MTVDHGELLDQLGRSHARLESTLNGLTDEQARQPSLLPGWSRGHVATHLSRNADALRRLTLGVLGDEQADQKPNQRHDDRTDRQQFSRLRNQPRRKLRSFQFKQPVAHVILSRAEYRHAVSDS